MNKTESAINMC